MGDSDHEAAQLLSLLLDVFGFSRFLSELQKQAAVSCVLAARRRSHDDVAVLAPSGSGKTIACSVAVARIYRIGGRTLTISDDPVGARAAWMKSKGLDCETLSSDQHHLRSKVIFVSLDEVLSPESEERLLAICTERLAAVFVDISESSLTPARGEALEDLRNRFFARTPLMLFASTSCRRRGEETIGYLNLRDPWIISPPQETRRRMRLSVELRQTVQEAAFDLKTSLKRRDANPTIIHCQDEESCYKLAATLVEAGVTATALAQDLTEAEQREVEDNWTEGLCDALVVSPELFSEELFKSGLRKVVYFGAPIKMEEYRHHVEVAEEEGTESSVIYAWRPVGKRLDQKFLESRNCRHRFLASHYGDEVESNLESCRYFCDNCCSRRFARGSEASKSSRDCPPARSRRREEGRPRTSRFVSNNFEALKTRSWEAPEDAIAQADSRSETPVQDERPSLEILEADRRLSKGGDKGCDDDDDDDDKEEGEVEDSDDEIKMDRRVVIELKSRGSESLDESADWRTISPREKIDRHRVKRSNQTLDESESPVAKRRLEDWVERDCVNFTQSERDCSRYRKDRIDAGPLERSSVHNAFYPPPGPPPLPDSLITTRPLQDQKFFDDEESRTNKLFYTREEIRREPTTNSKRRGVDDRRHVVAEIESDDLVVETLGKFPRTPPTPRGNSRDSDREEAEEEEDSSKHRRVDSQTEDRSSTRSQSREDLKSEPDSPPSPPRRPRTPSSPPRSPDLPPVSPASPFQRVFDDRSDDRVEADAVSPCEENPNEIPSLSLKNVTSNQNYLSLPTSDRIKSLHQIQSNLENKKESSENPVSDKTKKIPGKKKDEELNNYVAQIVVNYLNPYFKNGNFDSKDLFKRFARELTHKIVGAVRNISSKDKKMVIKQQANVEIKSFFRKVGKVSDESDLARLVTSSNSSQSLVKKTSD